MEGMGTRLSAMIAGTPGMTSPIRFLAANDSNIDKCWPRASRFASPALRWEFKIVDHICWRGCARRARSADRSAFGSQGFAIRRALMRRFRKSNACGSGFLFRFLAPSSGGASVIMRAILFQCARRAGSSISARYAVKSSEFNKRPLTLPATHAFQLFRAPLLFLFSFVPMAVGLASGAGLAPALFLMRLHANIVAGRAVESFGGGGAHPATWPCQDCRREHPRRKTRRADKSGSRMGFPCSRLVRTCLSSACPLSTLPVHSCTSSESNSDSCLDALLARSACANACCSETGSKMCRHCQKSSDNIAAQSFSDYAPSFTISQPPESKQTLFSLRFLVIYEGLGLLALVFFVFCSVQGFEGQIPKPL